MVLQTKKKMTMMMMSRSSFDDSLHSTSGILLLIYNIQHVHVHAKSLGIDVGYSNTS